MKHRYFNMKTRAIVECDPVVGIEVPEPDRTWRICRVMSPIKNKGYGSEVLRECLADADAEGIILTLEAIPYEYGRLEDLLRFYERHGFVFGTTGDTAQVGFRYPT